MTSDLGCAAGRVGFRRLAEAVLVLSYRNIKVLYKHTAFGLLWSLGVPLTLTIVFTLVFTVFFRIRIEDYPLFVLSMLFPWMFVQNALRQATTSYLSASVLIGKVPFPRSAVPLAAVASEAFHFVAALILLVALAVVDGRVTWSILAIIPFTVCLVAMTCGWALILAPLQVRFRDLKFFVDLVLTLGFYLVPIIYSLDSVPASYRPFIRYNPLALVLVPFRDAIYDGVLPSPPALVALAAVFLLSLGVGLAIHRRLAPTIADHV